MFSLKIRDWGLQRLLTSADFSAVIYTWRKMQVGCSFPHSCLSQVPHPRAPTAPPWELVAPGIIQILCERQTQIPKPYLELTLDEFSVASDSTRWQAELSAPPASGEHRCCFSLQCKCFRVYSLALVVHKGISTSQGCFFPCAWNHDLHTGKHKQHRYLPSKWSQRALTVCAGLCPVFW